MGKGKDRYFQSLKKMIERRHPSMDTLRGDLYKKMVLVDNISIPGYTYAKRIIKLKFRDVYNFLKFVDKLESDEAFSPIKITYGNVIYDLTNCDSFMQFVKEKSPRNLENVTIFTGFTELQLYKIKIIGGTN